MIPDCVMERLRGGGGGCGGGRRGTLICHYSVNGYRPH
jgi:hypothetical protein